ncbi:MAG TPA: hypothetical protein VG028_11325 [Terriglobia bacterium]|nr:hypothetical protein [Terriglobia bacterium]
MADETLPLRAPKIEGRNEPVSAMGRRLPKPWTVPPRGLAVFHGSGETARLSHYFLPRLLLEGKRILFLDGANSADPRLLARLARERGIAFEQFSRQIQIARAFTCFQLTELIARVPRFLEKFPAQVLMVTALPDLYFDGDVRDWDARVAFEHALADLRRYGSDALGCSGDVSPVASGKWQVASEDKVGTAVGTPPLQIAVFSSARSFTPPPARQRFFQQTCAAATEVWKFSLDEGGRTKLLCVRSLSVKKIESSGHGKALLFQ